MRRIKWETNRCWEQKRNFVSPKAFKWGKTLFIVCSGSPGAFAESTEKIVLSAQKATHADLKREEKKLLDMLVCSLHGKMTLRDIKLYKCGYLSRADARWIRRALKQTFSSFESSKVSERDLRNVHKFSQRSYFTMEILLSLNYIACFLMKLLRSDSADSLENVHFKWRLGGARVKSIRFFYELYRGVGTLEWSVA